MRPERERGAVLVEALLVALGILLPLLTVLTGLAKVQQASQATATAAREAVRAAVTTPALQDWRSAAEAAARSAVASQGNGTTPAVETSLVDGAPGGRPVRGGFVTVTVRLDVALFGWPFDAPSIAVVAHGNGRFDPHRADCTGGHCR